eukprot:CAMPEP_0198135478 /NCGR_PEP_ID=MMETSP1442-20131203/60610_1 /TAXON_ID= /ORGANISM="Craspedostauros australis, Strain CCMP3328" /LENGTH=283 /DNA_ID=CAMNT_0043796651 /DNA_START=758 /DNA_END=1610 /DNA_ORIENTATION=-
MSAEATTEEPKKEEPTEKTTEPAAEDEDDEDDVEKLEAEIARMEAEAARITKETEELEKKDSGGDAAGAKGSAAAAKPTDAASKDKNSVYVGQVDYTATPEELLSHFEACGTVERVTIVCDKYSGRPKGFAYIEFGSEASVENAVKLNGSDFKGRQLKVTHKRVNLPDSSAAGVKADVEGAVVEAVATVADAAVTEEATAEDVVATSPTIIIEHISSPCHDRDQQFQVLPSSKVCAGTSIQIRVHGQAGECAVSCHIVSCYSMLLGWAAGRRGQGWQPFMLQA